MEVIDADAIVAALRAARRSLAEANREALLSTYHSLASDAPYEVNEAQVGARRLRNACLGYLAKLREDDTTQLCLEQFRSAQCMTDSIAALSSLSGVPGDARDEAMAAFYARAKANNELLVINKWLMVQAMADTPTALEDVKALMGHESFDKSNPNTFRALVNTFAGGNPAAFHKKDGSGYAFIADQVIELDARNPQVAARLAGSFNTWRRHDEERQVLMKAQLEHIQAEAKSKDTKEIVGRALAPAAK
jgi:aminopeptidase N